MCVCVCVCVYLFIKCATVIKRELKGSFSIVITARRREGHYSFS